MSEVNLLDDQKQKQRQNQDNNVIPIPQNQELVINANRLQNQNAAMQGPVRAENVQNAGEMSEADRFKGLVNSFQVRDANLYEHIVSDVNRQKNINLQEKVEKTVSDGEWELPPQRALAAVPQQQLPAAKNTWKERRAENKSIYEAQRTYSYADKCTGREKAALEAHFSKNWPVKMDNRGHSTRIPPTIKGTDEANDPVLMEYVRSVTDYELTDAHFSDAYLSEHIAEMHEYGRKLASYGDMKAKYPKFFAALKDEVRAKLEIKAAQAEAFNDLIQKHLELHGLSIANGVVSLRRDTGTKREKRAAYNAKNRAFEEAKLTFYKKNVLDASVQQAEIYENNKEIFKSDAMIDELNKRIND